MARTAQWFADRPVRIKVLASTAAAANARGSYAHHRTVALVVLGIGLAVAAGIGLLVASVITRGIRSVQYVAEGLAVGDLTRSTG